MLKKISALLLILVTLFSLFSCGNKYPPVESTEEESRVVMKLTCDDKVYEVKYELYRALFLSYRSEIDGGNTEVWVSEDAAEYKAKIDKIILSSITDIYATLHLADKVGINPYSSAVEDKIEEYIVGSVEGYDDGNISAIGFEGDYDKYLEHLKSKGLNYSTQVLLFRYAIVTDMLQEYYIGTTDSDNPTPDMKEGALKYTDEDIKNYYNSDECVRVLMATIDGLNISEAEATRVRDNIAAAPNDDERMLSFTSLTLSNPADVQDGVLIGKYSLDAAFYAPLIDEAFSIAIGETGRLIKVSTESASNYHIIHRIDKTEDYLNRRFEDVKTSYLSSEINKMINSIKGALIESAEYTDVYNTLNPADIKFP